MKLNWNTLVLLLTAALIPHAKCADKPFLNQIRAGQPVKVVTMGTSLTAPSLNWVPQITAWLQGEAPDPARVTVANVGVGASSSDNADPVYSGIKTQLPNALAQNPDVVFIEYGMNDAFLPYNITQQQSRENLNTIINRLKAGNPKVQFVLMTMDNPVGVHLEKRPKVAEYYQGYRDMASKLGATLVDNYPVWLGLYTTNPTLWNSYVPDGIHPNSIGAANVITPQIRRTLAGRVAFALGGFETPVVDGEYNLIPAKSGLGVWQVTSLTGTGNAAVLWNAARLNSNLPDLHASEGSQMITLQCGNTPAVLSQTFDTVPGAKYQLTFDLTALVGKGSGSPTEQALAVRVSAAGQSREFTVDVTAAMAGEKPHTLPYTTGTFQFTADSASTTVSFENKVLYTGDQNFGLTLDNVKVEPLH